MQPTHMRKDEGLICEQAGWFGRVGGGTDPWGRSVEGFRAAARRTAGDPQGKGPWGGGRNGCGVALYPETFSRSGVDSVRLNPFLRKAWPLWKEEGGGVPGR